MAASPPVFVHGNYPNYYTRRYRGNQQQEAAAAAAAASVEQDPRLVYLKRQLPVGARLLDIGCNVGTFGVRLAQATRARSLLGVDIDAELVAEATLRYAHDPTAHLDEFQLADSATCFAYFPAHAVAEARLSDAELRACLQRARERHMRATAIAFRAEDYVAAPAPPGEQFDVILCLSVVKWVHLNGGDDAVRALFRKAFAQLAPGGIFAFEPQPWSSYRKYKALFPPERVAGLQFRPDQFHAYLLSAEVGFVDSKTHELNTPTFKRAVTLYFKASEQSA